jgi:hypothetical protein
MKEQETLSKKSMKKAHTPICIARKTKLSPTVNGIAGKIQLLFRRAKIVRSYEVEVTVDFLRDPKTFLALLESAYSVKKVSATFGGPNPFDADGFFQRPLLVYLQNAMEEKEGRSSREMIEMPL